MTTSLTVRPQAVITGGTKGIGKSVCLTLAKHGYDIAFTYRSSIEQSYALCEEIKTFGVHAKGFEIDLTKEDSIKKGINEVMAEFPNPQVLVNNAGVAIDGLSIRYKLEDWDKIFQTNVRGSFQVTQSLLRPMIKSKSGSIIFISSVVGQMGNPGQAAYCASKAALFGLVKSLAREVASRNIRVNAVSPGFIQTDMTESLPESTKQSIFAQIPLGAMGTSQNVADAVAFLAGSESCYITGQTLNVNGGLYM